MRVQFLLPTGWVKRDSIFARLDLPDRETDCSAADVSQAILGWAARCPEGSLVLCHTILELDCSWMELPEVRRLAPRLRLQVNSFKEVENLAYDFPTWCGRGFGVDLFLDHRPTVKELALASQHLARIVFCPNPFAPLDKVTCTRLDQMAPDWKIWFPPRADGDDSFFSAREMDLWLTQNPERVEDLLIFSVDEAPLCPTANPYFHDLKSDPLDIGRLPWLQKWIVRTLATSSLRWLRFSALVLLGLCHQPLKEVRSQLLQALFVQPYWKVRTALHRALVFIYWRAHAMRLRLRQVLAIAANRAYWLWYTFESQLVGGFYRVRGWLRGLRIQIYWGCVRGFRLVEGLGSRLYWAGVRGLRLVHGLGSGLYWASVRASHFFYRVGLRAYWRVIQMSQFFLKVGSRLYWLMYHLSGYCAIFVGRFKGVLICFYWQARRLAWWMGNRLYWGTYSVGCRVIGASRRWSLVLFYPARKFYWFTDHQVQTRLVPLLNRRAP